MAAQLLRISGVTCGPYDGLQYCFINRNCRRHSTSTTTEVCNGISMLPRRRIDPQVITLKIFASSNTAPDSASPITTDPLQGSHVNDVSQFQPCVWKNYFFAYGDPNFVPSNANEEVHKEHKRLKEEIRQMISKLQNTPITAVNMRMPLKEKLRFIDTLQRIGLSFQFEREISDVLRRVHLYDDFAGSDDLYTIATAFRLIRDQGTFVPASIFEKFLDDVTGEFKEAVSSDVDGLMALYEATYYDITDENILDRAREFTIKKLKLILPDLEKSDPINFKKVEQVLHTPMRRNSERVVAKNTISIYKVEPTFGESLLKLAVHDFNIRQFSFQNELCELTRWWEESTLEKNLPFVRQMVVASFFFSTVVFPEPQYKIARRLLAKLNIMMSTLDDIYDTYGTEEELELFTDALIRMDPNASLGLKQYMRAVINGWNDLYAEIEQHNFGRPYILYYTKREVEKMVWAYLVDSKWIHSKTIPTVEEYFDTSIIIYGLSSAPCIFYVGMGELVTEQAFSWATDDPAPNLMRAAAVFCKCLDDLNIEPNEAGKTNTAIMCYMKQYGVTEEEAKELLKTLAKDSIKEVNKGMLNLVGDDTTGANKSTQGIPKPLLKVMYGYIQAGDIFNRHGDSFSDPRRLKDVVNLLFVEPATLLNPTN